MKQFDVLVFGAGIAGVSTALHLQALGRSVGLIDRREPIAETSYGNAGLVQREAAVPYSFPRDPGKLLSYALNLSPEANLHWRAIPWLIPFLYRYWRAGSATGTAATARALVPLLDRCTAEHDALAQRAGVADMFRRVGFLRLYRDAAKLEAHLREDEDAARRYGVVYAAKTAREIAEMEPSLTGDFVGGIHMPQATGTGDPGAVGRAYVRMFSDGGGAVLRGDAKDLVGDGESWVCASAAARAANAVLALGPWTAQVLGRIGFRVPMGVKRGYHMRYAARPGSALSRTMLDRDYGFALTPEPSGALRVTTGAEFARLDAAPTPVQLARIEPVLRRDYPVGARLMAEPWMGARPCFPDLLPAIGPVPGQPGLWLNTGHQHLGFTLGPVTGRLLAQMMCGKATAVDPAPYRVDRF